MTPDIDKVTALVQEVAATEILRRFRSLTARDVSEKSPGDLVTVADLAVERALERRLPDLVPGSVVVGEEAVHHNPDILDRLSADDSVWIIDPIDGTTNFASGNPLFAVQLAYVRSGETRAAWIHAPLAGRTAAAGEGQGAWMAGQRLQVAAPASTDEMAGALYAGPTRPGMVPNISEIRKRYGDAAYRRCVGQEYLSLAAAEIHFALFTRLLPWDHAAGIHIHTEAGGYNALVDGTAYRPTLRHGYILLAPDESSWLQLRDMFIAPWVKDAPPWAGPA